MSTEKTEPQKLPPEKLSETKHELVHKIDLSLKRDGINGLDGKTDAEHVTDWLKSAFAGVTSGGADPITHLVLRKLMDKLDALKSETTVNLNELEMTLVRWALLSSRFTGSANKMACQMFEKFGINL